MSQQSKKQEVLAQVSAGLRAVRLPIFTLTDRRICGYEMLIRGEGGTAEGVFAIAQRNGILDLVDVACLKTTAVAAREIVGARVHLNVYPFTLLSVDRAELSDLLEPLIQPDRQVCLELIESHTMPEPAVLRDIIADLQRRGFEIAIDDVGFGFSSLETLITLEPDILKLDRSLVTGAHQDERLRRKLERLVAVAKALGARMVAEGVDTPEDLELCLRMQIQMGQGLLTGPLPV